MIEQVPADETGLMRSILAKLKGDGCVELARYGPLRPEKVGQPVLGFDETAWADLTDEEAALWERIEPTS